MEQKKQFSLLSKIYISLVALSCIPLIIYAFAQLELSRIYEFLFWIALIAVLEYNPVTIFTHDDHSRITTITSATMFTATVVLGIQGALFVAMIGLLIAETILKTQYYKTFFNMGQYGLTVLISGWLFFELKHSPHYVVFNIFSDWTALAVLIVSHYIINSLLVSLVMSLTTGFSFFNIFLHDIKISLLHHATSSTIGLAMVSVYNSHHPYIVLLFIPPLFLIDQAFRWYYALHTASTKTIIALADIVDKRDKYTAEHSSRVAKYAELIATRMKLPSEEIVNITIGASVHDLGKIGIEDSIISKDSILTTEEYEQIKKHPEIAYELIKNLRPYEKSSAYVLHHHEWVNGNGYPKGLKDREIPLGAKIVGVADAFDAMTKLRPYRRAYTTEEAVEELKRCSGTQFDSSVVNALIEVLKVHNGYTGY